MNDTQACIHCGETIIAIDSVLRRHAEEKFGPMPESVDWVKWRPADDRGVATPHLSSDFRCPWNVKRPGHEPKPLAITDVAAELRQWIRELETL